MRTHTPYSVPSDSEGSERIFLWGKMNFFNRGITEKIMVKLRSIAENCGPRPPPKHKVTIMLYCDSIRLL